MLSIDDERTFSLWPICNVGTVRRFSWHDSVASHPPFVTDIDHALPFYRDVLGFAVTFTNGDPICFVVIH